MGTNNSKATPAQTEAGNVATSQRDDFDRLFAEANKGRQDGPGGGGMSYNYNEKGDFVNDTSDPGFIKRKAAYDAAKEATWNDVSKRNAFLASKYALGAQQDKTDFYLRNTGLKRATGSQAASFLGGY